ncbi:unnamed protein product [Clonostachys rhizophaga]|uniref:Uncharacterized protein n=1 Tax=Clonostachys rhizophaga TaxID=160324 RepID=A0A9N9W4H1_9HYPO|nr:unnamed protein product [Clonostachys rhizophaga]
MQSSIPYDPSLVLGSVLSNATLQLVNEISRAEAPVSATREELEALVASRKSLGKTKSELINLGIDTSPIDDEINNLSSRIASVTEDYARIKLKVEAAVGSLRSKIYGIGNSAGVERPIDFLKAQQVSIPLAAESLKVDAQYFSMDPNEQSANSFASNISSVVSDATSWLGTRLSAEISQAAEAQVLGQVKRHSVAGTLILSASCTHRDGLILEPLAIDPEKGIKAWNRLFPDDRIDATKPREMVELARTADGSEADNKLGLVSGMSLGSSFIGMVHVLNSTSSNVQTPAVRSHVTFLTTGTTPEVTLSESASDKPELDTLLPALQRVQLNDLDDGTLNPGQLGQGLVDSALTKVNSSISKLLDVNYMTAALNDFLRKASSGGIGVPLSYHLRQVNKGDIAEAWVAKYHPESPVS